MRCLVEISALGCLALVACGGAAVSPASAWKAADPAPVIAPPVRMEVAAQEPSALPPAREPSESAAPAPTWTAIYARYLGPGTVGGCAGTRACHASVMSDAATTYSWLAQRGYIAGPQSALVGSNSCLRWFGGNMPPRGASDTDAARELEAWVAAGAANN
jgi:hypothetical protein